MSSWLLLLVLACSHRPLEQAVEVPRARPMVSLEEDMEATLEAMRVEPAMVAWARRVAPARLPTPVRLRRLLRGMLAGDGLALEQIVQPTFGARRAFAEGRANCVAFAALFGALARAEGIPVIFVRVGGIREGWNVDSLRFVEGHVAAAWRDREGLRIYDFGGESRRSQEEVVPLSDLTLLALFASNWGAEALASGEVGLAVGHLERAVELDPWLAEAWTNLGVARRWAGNLEGAATAYRQALRLDPTAQTASQNLATLLHLEGRSGEASRALEVSRRLGAEDALGFLHHGLGELEAGDIEEARSYYRKALQLALRRSER